MAVRLLNTDNLYTDDPKELFADAKADITPGMTVIGLPENMELPWGSSVVTGDFKVGFLKSTGSWGWSDEQEESNTNDDEEE